MRRRKRFFDDYGRGIRKFGRINANLDAILNEIYDGAYERCNGESRPPDDTHQGYLKRTIYQVGSHILETKQQAIFEDFVAKDLRYNFGTASISNDLQPKTNPFYWLYRCVFRVEEEDQRADRTSHDVASGKPEKSIVSRAQRAKVSRQLVYAHSQGVPEEYVVGFIYQIGGRVPDR